MILCTNHIDFPITAISKIHPIPGDGTLITLDITEMSTILRHVIGRVVDVSLFIWDGLHWDETNKVSLAVRRSGSKQFDNYASYDITFSDTEQRAISLIPRE